MRVCKQLIKKVRTFCTEGIWLCYADRNILWHGSGPFVLSEGRVTSNQYKAVLSDNIYPIKKHCYSDGTGLMSVKMR